MRVHKLAILLIPLVIVTAGCLEAQPSGTSGADSDEETFAVGGSFTENATQEDVQSLDAEVQARNGTLDVMDSHPMQYAARDLVRAECDEVRQILLDAAYVASVGDCEPVTGSENPDDSTSSPGADETYRLGGAFTENATQEDVDALGDEAEARNGTLRVMESYPMQYAIDDLEGDACEDLREALLDAPYLETVGDCQVVTSSENPDETTSSGEPLFKVGGAFTENATQEDVNAMHDEVVSRGGTLNVMSSYPMQYNARELGEAACEELRDVLADAPYVASVGACEAMAESGDTDEAVASDE